MSKVKTTYDFNVGVCCDTFEVEVGDRKIHAFSVICEGTNYHVVVPLWKGKTAEETRRACRRGWKSPFGSPIRLFTDGGSEFGGVFQEGLFLDGTADERSAAYSPWQNSLIARHGQTWKSIFHKVCNTVIPSSVDEIEEVFDGLDTPPINVFLGRILVFLVLRMVGAKMSMWSSIVDILRVTLATSSPWKVVRLLGRRSSNMITKIELEGPLNIGQGLSEGHSFLVVRCTFGDPEM